MPTNNSNATTTLNSNNNASPQYQSTVAAVNNNALRTTITAAAAMPNGGGGSDDFNRVNNNFSPTRSGSVDARAVEAAAAAEEPISAHHAIIRLPDETLHIYGYRRSLARTTLMVMASLLTLGVVRLLLHWSPMWLVRATSRRATLANADRVLVRDEHERLLLRPVRELVASAKRGGNEASTR